MAYFGRPRRPFLHCKIVISFTLKMTARFRGPSGPFRCRDQDFGTSSAPYSGRV